MLPEQLVVEFVAVSDHQCLATLERWGSQCPASPGDQTGQVSIAEPFGIHVDVPELSSTCDIQVRRLASQGHGVSCVDGFGASISLLADPGIGFGKEPLRFDAAGSSLAVVIPVDPCGHGWESLIAKSSGW